MRFRVMLRLGSYSIINYLSAGSDCVIKTKSNRAGEDFHFRTITNTKYGGLRGSIVTGLAMHM